MTKKVASPTVVFPSDKLIELLISIQLANGKIMKGDLSDRPREDSQWEIERAIVTVIRSTIHVDKCSSPPRLSSFPLSNGKMFVVSFALRLIGALTPIVGNIRDGKDDEVLRLLYQELLPIGTRQEITDGNYAFAFANGEYMVCLHVAHPTKK